MTPQQPPYSAIKPKQEMVLTPSEAKAFGRWDVAMNLNQPYASSQSWEGAFLFWRLVTFGHEIGD